MDALNLSTGIDVLEVARVEGFAARHGERFYQRFFTEEERLACGDQWVSLTGRIAAKEAVGKALGTGIGDVRWVEIEILNDVRGKPYLVLHGSAATLAEALGLTRWSISITHTRTQAIAMAVAIGSIQP